ncbi:MAG: cytochrome C [Brachymonas sp.]|nr:cytochrome C [Brachymonas sp.]
MKFAKLLVLILFLHTLANAQTLNADNAKRMQACTTCHGAGVTATIGRTANEVYFPRIAGKPAGYLHNQLKNFRDGRRHYGLMVGLVEHLNDAALLEMAQYFAQLDLPYPEPQAPPAGTSAAAMQRGQQLAMRGDPAKGIAACVSCHGANLLGVQPAIPGLLGLPRDYVAGQVGAWQTGDAACPKRQVRAGLHGEHCEEAVSRRCERGEHLAGGAARACGGETGGINSRIASAAADELRRCELSFAARWKKRVLCGAVCGLQGLDWRYSSCSS